MRASGNSNNPGIDIFRKFDCPDGFFGVQGFAVSYANDIGFLLLDYFSQGFPTHFKRHAVNWNNLDALSAKLASKAGKGLGEKKIIVFVYKRPVISRGAYK